MKGFAAKRAGREGFVKVGHEDAANDAGNLRYDTLRDWAARIGWLVRDRQTNHNDGLRSLWESPTSHNRTYWA